MISFQTSVAKDRVMDPRANPFGPMMQISHVRVNKTAAISPDLRRNPTQLFQITKRVFFGPGNSRLCEQLVKTNQDIAPDPRSEVDLRLQVEFNSNRKRSVLEVAVLVNCSLEEISWARVSEKLALFKAHRVGGTSPTGPLGGPDRPGMGRWW